MSKTLLTCGIATIALFVLNIASCSESPSVSMPSPHISPPTNCFFVSPPNPGTTTTVKNIAELVNAVQQANASDNMTILLEDGTYTVDDMLWISGNNISFRSRSGNRDAVIIRGQGMVGGVSHVFN